jgi:hypothetical protein
MVVNWLARSGWGWRSIRGVRLDALGIPLERGRRLEA